MKTLKLVFFCLTCLTAGMTYAQDAAAETAAGVYNEGLTALKAKEYSKAYDLLMKAIDIAKPEEDAQVLKLAKQNGSIAAYYAGMDLIKTKSFDDAMSKFDKGIELNPASYTNFYGKAKSFDDQGKLLESIEAYFKANEVAVASNNADRGEKYISRAANMIGVSYGEKKYDEVIKAGELFLATHESVDVCYYMAKALLEKGKSTDALPHAQKAFDAGQATEEGKYILAMAEVYEASGNKSAASEWYAKVPQGKYYKTAQYKVGQLK